jgi:indole-3-acetate monooxygenase
MTKLGVTTDWLERARGLELLVSKYRDEGETGRQMPQPLFEAINNSGLFGLWLPRSFGGPELDLSTTVQVVEEVSRQDGAVGWNVMIGVQCSAFAGYLTPSAARDFFADPLSVGAGSSQPKGSAVRVDGGYRLSGRWPLASGCNHAKWLAGGVLLYEDGTSDAAGNGKPDLNVLLFPVSKARIVDTWYTAGLRGTGSHDIEVEDIFVPEDHRFSWLRGRGEPGSIYSLPIPALFSLPLATVGLGVARAAIEAFVELASSKIPTRSETVLSQRGSVHASLGRSDTALRAARALVFETIAGLEQHAKDGQELSPGHIAAVLATAAFAAETAGEVCSSLFKLAGSSAIYASSRLERCFRDASMVTQHVVTNVFNFDNAGRSLLSKEA